MYKAAGVPEDGFRGGINYDGNDRFVFNGSRMMVAHAKDSNYFSAGNTYYPEMQDWSKSLLPTIQVVNLPRNHLVNIYGIHTFERN